MAITYLSGQRIQGSNSQKTPSQIGSVYEHFDASVQASASTWNDQSGNGLNLTVSGATVVSSGQNGLDYLSFDGSNDKATNSGKTSAPTASFSWALVVKIPANDGSNVETMLRTSGSGNDYVKLSGATTDDRIHLETAWSHQDNDSGSYFTESGYRGQWAVLIGTFTHGGKKRIYAGNSSEAVELKATSVNDYDSTDNTVGLGTVTKIGTNNDNQWGNMFAGEVISFNKALSATEASELGEHLRYKWGLRTTNPDDKATVTDVPTGSQFEETDTRKFYQRAGISNPLSQPSGLGDKVWDLTHASSYMTVDSDIVKSASDATISFWWRPASVSASQGVIKHKSGSNASDYSFLIEFSPSNMLRAVVYNSSSQSSDIRSNTGILTANTWHHIVFTWDTSAGDGQWYLDGSAITTNSNSTNGVNAPRSTDYQFGSTSQGGESLGGYVSDFAIYDTILPATGSNSIASLYNSGDGAKANTVATSNLRCYWSGKDGDESTIDNEATGASADTDADFDTVSNVSSAGKTPARWVERGTAI